ncbi:hypothetical protein D3C80_1505060 [compost metagenome]
MDRQSAVDQPPQWIDGEPETQGRGCGQPLLQQTFQQRIGAVNDVAVRPAAVDHRIKAAGAGLRIAATAQNHLDLAVA